MATTTLNIITPLDKILPLTVLIVFNTSTQRHKPPARTTLLYFIIIILTFY